MKIYVTQEDIDNGKHNPSLCPISLAIMRALGVDTCFVGFTCCMAGEKQYKLPGLVTNFICEFEYTYVSDRSKLKPIEFEIEEIL